MNVAFLSVFLQEIRLKPISPMAMTSHKPEVGFFFSNPRACFFHSTNGAFSLGAGKLVECS